jgi:uncharacterized cupin superfamily protein
MSEPAADPPPITRPVASEDVPWEPWGHGERFGGRVRPIGERGGAQHVGVHIEELPPGKQSCPFHYHMLEEEHMYALEGTATLRLGDTRYTLKPGDYVCFPAGQRAGHALVNEGTAPFRFLMIGERNPNEVCVYPDSGKVMVRSLKILLRGDAKMEYWDGEE